MLNTVLANIKTLKNIRTYTINIEIIITWNLIHCIKETQNKNISTKFMLIYCNVLTNTGEYT